MKKISIILLFLTAVCPLAQAQRVKVYVTDAWDKPLGEVAVTLGRGRTPVAVTGADGMAEVDAGEGDRMTLTLLNRMSRTVAVSGGEMHIRLTDDDVLFDVGYDERIRKGSASASLAGATAREIEAGGRTDLMSNLYGLIPGLGVRQGENLPWDSAPDLNVRGVGSFGGNSVVVLVDGIERDAACLDREEVEHITVLKDAASLALYGNRGADGIVAITTRRGGDHGLRTRIDYNFSVQTPFRIPDMADAATYATAVNEALENDGLAPRYTQRDIRSMVRGGRTDVLPNVDWRKAVLRNAGFNHDLNLSFDGSGGRMRYFVLANYNSNRGFLDNTDLNDGYSTQVEMYSLKLRSNLEAAITKTTTARMNLMGRLMQYQLPNAGVALDDMYDTPSAAFPIRVPGGGWARSQLFANPLADKTAGGYNTLLQRTLFADLTIDQDLSALTPGLSVQVRVAYDNSAEITDAHSRKYAYSNTSTVFDADGNAASLAFVPQGNDTELAFDSFLSYSVMRASVWAKVLYDRSFGKHTVTGRLIFSENKSRYRGANNTYMYRDYIASAGYNYDDRYVVNAVATYGGSSRMPYGDKYRFYPAVSGAWIISNEAFLRDSRVVDLLKLRASFGIVGMDARLSYDMDKQFNGPGNSYIFAGITSSNSLAQGALPSAGIEPERDYKTNVGLELSLLGSLSVEVDFFRNMRHNIRTSAAGTVSSVLGVGVPDVFTGKVRNYGGELAVGWRRRTGDFGYAVRGNIAYARNKILNKEEEYKPFDYMRITGQPVGTFYGLVADGMYQDGDFNADGSLKADLPQPMFGAVQPGDIKYRDVNGDGVVNTFDKVAIGYTLVPEINYGFGASLKWKGIDVSVFFSGVGHVTRIIQGQNLFGASSTILRMGQIFEDVAKNRWTLDNQNPNAPYPRLSLNKVDNNQQLSTYWQRDMSFLRLKDAEIGYTLPESMTKKWGLSKIRFYIQGKNLITFSDFKLWDPEVNANYGNVYPLIRTFAIGANVNF